MRSTARCATLAALVVVSACTSAPPAATPAATPTPNAAPAGPSIDSHEQYYDITGSSVQQLRDAMRRSGPREREGAPGDALTVWNLEWAYRDRRTGSGCALRDVRVTLSVTTTLPRWAPRADEPARLVQAWRTFVERVKVHEAGHRAIAEQSARDLMAALVSLQEDSCKQLWDAAARTATRVVEAGRAKSRAYDVETRHGQTQGAVLGP